MTSESTYMCDYDYNINKVDLLLHFLNSLNESSSVQIWMKNCVEKMFPGDIIHIELINVNNTINLISSDTFQKNINEYLPDEYIKMLCDSVKKSSPLMFLRPAIGLCNPKFTMYSNKEFLRAIMIEKINDQLWVALFKGKLQV